MIFLSPLYLPTCLKGIFKENVPMLDLWQINRKSWSKSMDHYGNFAS